VRHVGAMAAPGLAQGGAVRCGRWVGGDSGWAASTAAVGVRQWVGGGGGGRRLAVVGGQL
jgi:hypothetical protein